MLRQDRARSYAPRPRHLSRRAQKNRRPTPRSTEKSAGGVSFRDGLVLYLLHHFPNRFIHLPHLINAGRLIRRERNQFLNAAKLFAHIFNQRLAAKLGRDFIHLTSAGWRSTFALRSS